MHHPLLPDDVYSIPIEELDLRVRAYNCLKRSGVNKIGQLLSMRKKEVLAIRNLTSAGYEEIREQLIAHNFMSPSQLLGPFAEEDDEDGEAE